MKTTEEKEAELKGKRYKIITASIDKRKADGEEVPYEMEIDLHYAWMETMQSIKKDFGIDKNIN